MMAKETVSELTQKAFLDLLEREKEKLIVADFYAEWCMPCLMMAPIVESVAERNKEAKFCKINTEDSGELSRRYGISGIPCIIFFRNGEEVDRIVGSVSEEEFEDKVKDML